MYFGSNRPGTPGAGPNDIWISQRVCRDCPWDTPVNLGAPINTEFNDASPALSRDSHWLYFLSNRPGGMGSSDIWAAWRADVHDDFAWEAPLNLGAGVNTTSFEGGPSFFENEDGTGAELYFNRNPAPVQGGGDIYVSTQAADGSFGTAVAVAELNSPASDQRPAISSNGLEIYFFSDRPGSAAADIWWATRTAVGDPWSTPVNLGGPINTAASEFHPFIYSHGATQQLFFARNLASPPAMNLDLFVSMRTREKP